MANIHPLATVHPNAKLGENVEVGPYAYIEEHVEIGDGCRILPHATIFNYVKMGRNCTVFPGAVVGAVPQDLKFEGEITYVEIGDNVNIRECATINRGTKASGRGVTKIGNNVLLAVFETFSARASMTASLPMSVLMKRMPVSAGAGHTVIFATLPV